MEKGIYHKHISSKHKLFDLNIKDCWQYRDLILLFAKRTLQVKFKQTILGYAWLFISPLIASLIFWFVFGEIAKISTGGVPHILFYLSGTALWTYFSSIVLSNSKVFINNARIFGKVYFPRLTVPVATILSRAFEFLMQFILVIIFIIIFITQGLVSPNWIDWIILPIVLVQLGLMAMGIGIIISSLTTKYRDLTILVNFAVQLWMFVTPVVYPLSFAPANWIRMLLLINPVTSVMEAYKFAVLGAGEVLVLPLIWSWVFTIVVLLIGIVMFNKAERTFMDTI